MCPPSVIAGTARQPQNVSAVSQAEIVLSSNPSSCPCQPFKSQHLRPTYTKITLKGQRLQWVTDCETEQKGHVVPDQTLISFIVIAHNEEANIAQTIDSIAELKDLGSHEIIVVDDGSSDSTARIVSELITRNPNVRLIKLARNHGRGYARRTGVAAAHGELIAMIDADIVLPPNWLTCTRAALDSHDAVGGIAVPDGDVAYIYKRFGLVPRGIRNTANVTGSNGLYRRSIFDVANFDPALRDGEDSALNHEMDRLGLSSKTVPGLLVRHEENKTLAASLRWLFDIGRGATRQLVTYREVRQPDLVTGVFVGSAVAGLVLALGKHRAVGAAVPMVIVVVSGVQHVRSRFETPWSQWVQVAPAIAVDSAHLAAYFAGRLAGVTALWRRPDVQPSLTNPPRTLAQDRGH